MLNDDRLEAALNVLRKHGINPEIVEPADLELPEVGNVSPDETVYATSLDTVFDKADEWRVWDDSSDYPDDFRLRSWVERLQGTIASSQARGRPLDPGVGHADPRHGPEPHCAWYCPIHFFGYGWGIYIREQCILDEALRIASYVNWHDAAHLGLPFHEVVKRLLRAAFYVFFLHEQFHHKVESLGFRLLVASATDHYRPYKRNVYRRTFGTSNCLEESLANADSYLRLTEERYAKRLEPPFRLALRLNLSASFRLQPPGYREAVHYLDRDRFRKGSCELQSRVLDGFFPVTTPPDYWFAAPDVIRSMMDITEEIYVILPRGARPIFRPSVIDPGYTVSTSEFVRALTSHYGYSVEKGGGKGSHVKLTKAGAAPIVLKGNQSTLTPGLVKQALRTLGGFSLSHLPSVLTGMASWRQV